MVATLLLLRAPKSIRVSKVLLLTQSENGAFFISPRRWPGGKNAIARESPSHPSVQNCARPLSNFAPTCGPNSKRDNLTSGSCGKLAAGWEACESWANSPVLVQRYL